jgi:hypothetical protein
MHIEYIVEWCWFWVLLPPIWASSPSQARLRDTTCRALFAHKQNTKCRALFAHKQNTTCRALFAHKQATGRGDERLQYIK